MRVSPRNPSDARALSAGRPYQHAPAGAHVREHDRENKRDVEERSDTDFTGFLVPTKVKPTAAVRCIFSLYSGSRQPAVSCRCDNRR
jgi:hypothetical protein